MKAPTPFWEVIPAVGRALCHRALPGGEQGVLKDSFVPPCSTTGELPSGSLILPGHPRQIHSN